MKEDFPIPARLYCFVSSFQEEEVYGINKAYCCVPQWWNTAQICERFPFSRNVIA